MALTALEINKAAPRESAFKLTDGGGLFLLVQPNGGKYWRLAYRFNGKQKMLALGVYPDVPLALARQRRDDARKLLAQDVDPGEHKKAAKAAGAEAAANSFEVVAREWFGKHVPNWTKVHSDKIIQRLERDIFPWMGNRPVGAIEPPELLAVLRRIEARGALETAHRALADVARVFAYAVATGRAQRNPAPDLRGALPPYRKDKHFATITEPAKIGELMRAIPGYSGSIVTRCALQLSPYVFLRPGEIRKAQWCEIDLDAALWTIPAERMKMREPHLVPICHQAVAILREIHQLTGRGKYVFPGERDHDRPMSDNAVRSALRRMGYGNDEMTPHGFRAMASTTLDNMGYDPKLIERQLAHEEPNKVKAAYKRELWKMYLPERTKMMQDWANYLDGLAAGGIVIPFRAA